MKKRIADLTVNEMDAICFEHIGSCDECVLSTNGVCIRHFVDELHDLKIKKELFDRTWKGKKLTELSKEEREKIHSKFGGDITEEDGCPFLYNEECYIDLVEIFSDENKKETYKMLESLVEVNDGI